MLVLTRKLQQQIKIGEQITVTILRVKGNTVRLGVQAPREVRVIRGELPKTDAAGENAAGDTTEVIEFRVPLEAAESDEASTAGVENAQATPAKTTHLPLRRLRNRLGSGPLKQMIAASAALAK